MEPSGLAEALSTKLFGVNAERLPGFGKRVQELLNEAGINRSQAMRKLGTAYTTITKWVDGRNTPNVANIVPLAELAGVHIEWLITGKGPKYVDPTRNQVSDAAERKRLDTYRRAVEKYLESPLAADISAKTAALLRVFDFSSLGITTPEVKDVHRVRDLMDMQTQLRHFGADGDTD